MQKILVVAAHPDDEILGCGGAIAKHTKQGDKVWVLILGDGVGAREGSKDEEVDSRKEEAKKANDILGVENLIFKSFPDNKFDSVPLLDVIKEIETVVDEFEPNVILTHSDFDLNIDHKLTCEAVKTAARPMAGSSVEKILSFEIASSTEWNLNEEEVFAPQFFVNIEEEMDAKIKALEAYGSELREFPHPRSLEYVNSLAKVRGGQSGFKAAEAFEVIYIKNR